MPKAPKASAKNAKPANSSNLSKGEVIIIAICSAVVSAVIATVVTIFVMNNQDNCDGPDDVYHHLNNPDQDMQVVKKPIMYIYPEQEMDLQISLGNSALLTHTYPQYNNGWNIHVETNGNIHDYDTNRDYYALYWEALDQTPADFAEGFVVAGDKTVEFLEEKLSILGLNNREINEFITYWINDLEDNNYNFIRFRTTEEINQYMPVNFSVNPDTLIRVIVDFAKLDEPIEVKEQALTPIARQGFTVVEWGGRNVAEQLK